MPIPTYGYLGENGFLFNSKDDDLINDWVGETLEGMVYTDRYGRNNGVESFMRRIPIGNGCARRYHMRYTRGIKVKVDQWDNLDGLQIDRIALQKDIPARRNSSEIPQMN